MIHIWRHGIPCRLIVRGFFPVILPESPDSCPSTYSEREKAEKEFLQSMLFHFLNWRNVSLTVILRNRSWSFSCWRMPSADISILCLNSPETFLSADIFLWIPLRRLLCLKMPANQRSKVCCTGQEKVWKHSWKGRDFLYETGKYQWRNGIYRGWTGCLCGRIQKQEKQ